MVVLFEVGSTPGSYTISVFSSSNHTSGEPDTKVTRSNGQVTHPRAPDFDLPSFLRRPSRVAQRTEASVMHDLFVFHGISHL